MGNAPLPKFVAPQLATLVDQVPRGERWLREIKLDGYRMQLRVDGRSVSVLSRNGKDWTGRFLGLVERARDLGARRVLLDGEVVHVDEHGRTSFARLVDELGKGPACRHLLEGVVSKLTAEQRRELRRMRDAGKLTQSPFGRLRERGLGDARWAAPDLVGEVAFTEWTEDGRLRHPSFQGLHEDKPADEVVVAGSDSRRGGRRITRAARRAPGREA